MIKVRNIRDFTSNDLIIVGALSAKPVRVVVQFIFRLLGTACIFEANCYIVNIVENAFLDGHVELHKASP